MGHFNFPIFPVWDSLASETSSEELNCCVFGEFVVGNFHSRGISATLINKNQIK